MITEKDALRIAKNHALKIIDNGWDDGFHNAQLIDIDGEKYWEVRTNIAPSLELDWNNTFFPSPINYYIRASNGEFIGYKTHRDNKISHINKGYKEKS